VPQKLDFCSFDHCTKKLYWKSPANSANWKSFRIKQGKEAISDIAVLAQVRP
jgi:hypothetical protein